MFLTLDFGERLVSGRRLTVSIPGTGKSYFPAESPSVEEIIAIDSSKGRFVFCPSYVVGPFKFLHVFLWHLLFKKYKKFTHLMNRK